MDSQGSNKGLPCFKHLCHFVSHKANGGFIEHRASFDQYKNPFLCGPLPPWLDYACTSDKKTLRSTGNIDTVSRNLALYFSVLCLFTYSCERCPALCVAFCLAVHYSSPESWACKDTHVQEYMKLSRKPHIYDATVCIRMYIMSD